MKFKIITLSFLVLIGVVFAGCEVESTSDSTMKKATEKTMQEMNRQVGMPGIKNFQERKLAKMIFELRDQANLITYTYIITITGKKIFLGKSIGYGLPYSIQYTNPMKIAEKKDKAGFAILPQADPNGLFMPSGLSATWVMLINPKTKKAQPVYIENEIIVSPFPL